MHRDLEAATTTRISLREQLLAAWPDLAEDDQTLMDSLSGLDEFEEQVLATLRHAIEREAHGKAIGELIDGMRARKQRLENGAQWLRAAVLNAMQETGCSRIKGPDMSVSVGPGKAKVIVTDAEAVPDALCRISREPNKTEIAKALAAGQDVPGVVLGNANPFLSVRRA